MKPTLKPITPSTHPTDHPSHQPPAHPSAHTPHPKNPSVKSMAPPAPRECNQPARSALHRKQSAHRAAQRSALHRNQLAAHCIANNPRTVQRSAAHCLASCTSPRTARMQPPARSALHRNQPARSALHRNQPARSALHRKQSAHRQPTRHASPTAPAAHRLPHGEHLAPAALHALRSTLRWFRFVRGTNFSKIQFKYIVNCNFVMCS